MLAALSGNLNHMRAALTMPFYWPLATLAALRATLELLVRPHQWAKTAHGVSPRTRMIAPVLTSPEHTKRLVG